MDNLDNKTSDKIISIVVPCYNSAAYMRRCIDSLLTGGKGVEILVVDDGSSDDTLKIAREYEKEHPDNVIAIHQENLGHGGAVMTGIKAASAPYFKVVDSDDWLDADAFKKVLRTLRKIIDHHMNVDAVVCNFVMVNQITGKKKTHGFRPFLPEDCVLTWDDVHRLPFGRYIMMHALIYRVDLLRTCGMNMPNHTYYVDDIYVYVPMHSVKLLYYLNVNLYHYAVGRQDQSVQEDIMIQRLDQLMKVNLIMLDSVQLSEITDKHQKQYLSNFFGIVTAITCSLLIKTGSEENLKKKEHLWKLIHKKDPAAFRMLRHSMAGILVNFPGGKAGRWFTIRIYNFSRKFFGY